MAEVAQAYVTLLPSTRGFARAADSALSGDMQKVGEDQGKKTGSSMGKALGTALKGGALLAGAGAVALIGTTLAKGFSRLQGIDQARAKLTGLGHDGQAVDKIMSNALDSVKGTAFGLDQAATVAASAVASGVKPGEALERTLKLVADTATIAGTDMNEMGAIFNKVAAGGVIQGEEIAQLGDRGIPILQFLAQELGVTAQEAKKMASEGKISFETFQNAMETGLGGAALSSGDTFTGALANVNAALGRIGAGLLGGIFPHLAPMFKDITTALGPLEAGAAKLGDAIGAKLGPVIDRIGPALIQFTSGLDFSNLGAGSGAMSEIADSLTKIGSALAGVDWSQLGSAFAGGAADTINVFAVAIGLAADHIDTFAKILPGLVVAFAAYKTAQAAANVAALAAIPLQAAQVASNVALAMANRSLATSLAATTVAQNVGTAATKKSTVATIASTVAEKAAAAASKAWAAAQWLLNAALSANPIFLIVAAIAAVIAIIVLVVHKTIGWGTVWEWLKKVGTSAWEAIKTGLSAAWNFMKPIVAAISTIVRTHFTIIRTVVSTVIGWVVKYVQIQFTILKTVVTAVWSAIKTIITVQVKIIRTVVTAVWRGIRATTVAVWNGVKAVLTRIWSGISAVVRAYVNGVKKVVTVAWNAIRGITNSVWSGIRKAVSSALSAIRGVVSSGISRIKSTFSSGFGALRGAASKAMSGVRSAISDGISRAVGVMRGIGAKLTGPLTSAVGAMRSAGSALMGGLADGIGSKISDAIAKVKAGVDKIKGLLPGSPIKWGPLKSWNNGGAGKRLMELLAAGIKQSAPTAVRAMSTATSMISDVDAAIPGVSYLDPSLQARAASAVAANQAARQNTRYAMTITDWETGIGFIEALADGRVEAAELMYGQTVRAGAA